AVLDLFDDLGRAQVVEVVRRDHLEAKPRVVVEVLTRVDRASRSDMHVLAAGKQSFLEGPTERRTVREARPEVGVPRVQMSVEMQDGQGIQPGSSRPQQ